MLRDSYKNQLDHHASVLGSCIIDLEIATIVNQIFDQKKKQNKTIVNQIPSIQNTLLNNLLKATPQVHAPLLASYGGVCVLRGDLDISKRAMRRLFTSYKSTNYF